MNNEIKYIASYELLNSNQVYNDKSLIVFLNEKESISLLFDKVIKNYPNMKDLQFILSNTSQYQKIVEYLNEQNSGLSIQISANFSSIYSLKELAKIADEKVIIHNPVDCYNIYEVDKEDRHKLNYFDTNRIYNVKEKKEYPIDVFLNQIDNLVNAINKNANSDIQTVFLLDQFYHDYFSYDKKHVKAEKSLDKKIAKYERRTKLSKWQNHRLMKWKNKRDTLSMDSHYAYYLLKNRKGVCSAFSELSYLILNHPQLNIKTKMLYSEKEDHGLNSIEINGKEYIYDFTNARISNIKKDNWFVINLEALYKNMKLNIKRSQIYKKIQDHPKTKVTQLYLDNCKHLFLKAKTCGIELCRTIMKDRFVKNPFSLTTGAHYYIENDELIRKKDFSSYEQMPLRDITREIQDMKDKRIDLDEVIRKK